MPTELTLQEMRRWTKMAEASDLRTWRQYAPEDWMAPRGQARDTILAFFHTLAMNLELGERRHFTQQGQLAEVMKQAIFARIRPTRYRVETIAEEFLYQLLRDIQKHALQGDLNTPRFNVLLDENADIVIERPSLEQMVRVTLVKSK